MPYGELTSFPRAVQATDDEVVVFSWITYESRERRDAVNAKVMADPRMKHDQAGPPFDGKRMIFGGFTELTRFQDRPGGARLKVPVPVRVGSTLSRINRGVDATPGGFGTPS